MTKFVFQDLEEQLALPFKLVRFTNQDLEVFSRYTLSFGPYMEGFKLNAADALLISAEE